MLAILNMVGVVLFVVFFFGFCVFIHELGHFLVAKWTGLHINAFSIGFKKAWGFTHKGIEYRIGWLPFGGYVDLPQIDATGSDVEDDKGNPLPSGTPFQRISTAFAGPLFNILFGLALGSIIWMKGVPEASPRMSFVTVGHILEGAPSYEAGLRTGDKIVKMNGKEFNTTWDKFRQDFILTVGKVVLEVERDGNTHTFTFQPEVNPEDLLLRSEGLASPWFEADIPAIVNVQLNSEAYKAGVKDGDEVVSVNGKAISNRRELIGKLVTYEPQPYDLVVKRDGKEVVIPQFTPKASGKKKNLVGTVYGAATALVISSLPEDGSAYKNGLRKGDELVEINGEKLTTLEQLEELGARGELAKEFSLRVERDGDMKTIEGLSVAAEEASAIERLGIDYILSLPISKVIQGGAAEKAGMKEGDAIVAVNGKTLTSPSEFLTAIKGAKGTAVALTVMRDNAKVELKVTPTLSQTYSMGLDLSYMNHPTPWEQFTSVVDNSYRSLRGVGMGLLNKLGLSEKKTSLKLSNFSGPVGIARLIGQVVYYGSYLRGLSIIVMITFSLGLLNLMPLPVLDGGHIVMATIQAIIRRPLPAKIIQPLTAMFVFLLISFMLYVTFYDVKRVAGDVAEAEMGTELIIEQK